MAAPARFFGTPHGNRIVCIDDMQKVLDRYEPI